MIEISEPDDLGAPAIDKIAFQDERILVRASLLDRVATQREHMLKALEGQRVYGVNTGTGYLSETDLNGDTVALHQRRLLLGRAVGSRPWLPKGETRALIAVKLAEFLRGNAGVSAELCRFIVDRLNDDFVPAVPERSVGTSGEIQPLAHAFQTFVGEGVVLGDEGVEIRAEEALSKRGIDPYQPGLKEGIALLAGSSSSVALTLSRLRTAETVAQLHTVVAAASCEAIDAPRGPYDPILGDLSRDPLLWEVLRDLSDLIGPGHESARHQAPVSFRVVPQVLTTLRRTMSRVSEDMNRHAGAVTDSPVFVKGRFLTSGAFHAIDLAAGMDHLALALTHVGELSVQRMHRLLDTRFTGLPAQLSEQDGGAGLVVVHKRAVGALNELRRLATPASVGVTETSLGQEDAQVFIFECASRLRRTEEILVEIASCELLLIRQIWWLRRRPPRAGLNSLHGRLSAVVAPVEQDRSLGGDIDRITYLVWDLFGP